MNFSDDMFGERVKRDDVYFVVIRRVKNYRRNAFWRVAFGKFLWVNRVNFYMNGFWRRITINSSKMCHLPETPRASKNKTNIFVAQPIKLLRDVSVSFVTTFYFESIIKHSN